MAINFSLVTLCWAVDRWSVATALRSAYAVVGARITR
jgi:hypothetical protein